MDKSGKMMEERMTKQILKQMIAVSSVAVITMLVFIGSASANIEYDDDGVNPTQTSVVLALEHLEEIMDKYNSDFDAYMDLSAAGNHFILPAKMGVDAEINPGCFENPQNGATCIENKFDGTGNSWGGWYLMNGVLEGEETQPKQNWGEYLDAGFNLTGATELVFWARGEEGGERVEFFAFGVGRDPNTGNPTAHHPDSSPKRSLGYKTLGKEWQQYTI